MSWLTKLFHLSLWATLPSWLITIYLTSGGNTTSTILQKGNWGMTPLAEGSTDLILEVIWIFFFACGIQGVCTIANVSFDVTSCSYS